MSDTYGIKVSKAGKDVNSCGYNDLIFTSEFPLLKIHKQGGGSVTVNGAVGDTTLAIAHTTGITPMFIAYTEFYNINTGAKANHFRQMSFSDIFVTPEGATGFMLAHAHTDTGHLHFLWSSDLNPPGGGSLSYYYFIFEDPITE